VTRYNKVEGQLVTAASSNTMKNIAIWAFIAMVLALIFYPAAAIPAAIVIFFSGRYGVRRRGKL